MQTSDISNIVFSKGLMLSSFIADKMKCLFPNCNHIVHLMHILTLLSDSFFLEIAAFCVWKKFNDRDS